jgi:hypothetical protein
LDLKAQYAPLREEITRAVTEVMEAQAFVLGPVVEELEREVAAHVGAGHAIGCASGTDALILSLAALGIGPGDEVLTSPFSFFSSASCASKVGARPAFADIDPESFNLDPGSVEAALRPATKALLPVHLFGQCAEMDPLMEIASGRGLLLLLPDQEPRRLRQRRHDRDLGWRAGREAAVASRPRRPADVPPPLGRLEQPAGRPAGGGAEGQAAPPSKLVGRARRQR